MKLTYNGKAICAEGFGNIVVKPKEQETNPPSNTISKMVIGSTFIVSQNK